MGDGNVGVEGDWGEGTSVRRQGRNELSYMCPLLAHV